MAVSKSILVQNLLAGPEMHRQWENDYRTAKNEDFYERAFDYLVDRLKPAPGASVLDAGCGSCAHSVRLARRGFNVHAVDFSESALAMARSYVISKRLDERITFGRESLLQLSFPNQSFEYIVCWGVLMHIPEPAPAVAELARVLKVGGSLIVSEANKNSLEAVAIRNLRRLLGKEKADVRIAPEGIEYWKAKSGAALVTREADISWLIRTFAAHGLRHRARVAGQFSESYTRVSAKPLQQLVHGFNRFWFQRLSWPGPAFGNILIFQKQDPQTK